MQANSTKLRELERLYREGRFLRALAVVVFGALVVLWVFFPLPQMFLWLLVIDLLALGFVSRLLSDYRKRMNAPEQEMKRRQSDSQV
jgi:hypothetical protein